MDHPTDEVVYPRQPHSQDDPHSQDASASPLGDTRASSPHFPVVSKLGNEVKGASSTNSKAKEPPRQRSELVLMQHARARLDQAPNTVSKNNPPLGNKHDLFHSPTQNHTPYSDSRSRKALGANAGNMQPPSLQSSFRSEDTAAEVFGERK